jgi:SSS family solute:Na+ symporter
MMQAWWVFCICSVLFVIVSLLTPPPALSQTDGLTWTNPGAFLFGKKIDGASDPRLVAGLLLLTMAFLYYRFR